MTMPAQLGRYRLLELLGQGAMGAVYKAHDPELDRLVAVKAVAGVLLADEALRTEFRERFRREARAAARLNHPAIVAVYDVGFDEAAGLPFIVMEYVPGVTLYTVVQEQGALPVAQALELVEGVGAGLAEAHRQGIVHRDVKPGNVLLDTHGRARLSDFGIARLPGSELTRAGAGLGTPGYLAPEALRGEPADARTDLFALGVVAYVLLTGKKPFSGPTPEAAGLQVLQHDPPAPRALRPEVPEAVSAAVMGCLAKRPEERTQSVEAFLRALRGGVAPGPPATQTASGTRPTPAVEATRTSPATLESTRTSPAPAEAPVEAPATRTDSRRALLALLLLLLLLLLLIGGGVGLWFWLAPESAAPTRSAPPAARPASTPRPTLAPPSRPPEVEREEPGSAPPRGRGRGKAKGHGPKKEKHGRD